MTDYNLLEKYCLENSGIAEEVVDGYLIYYAAGRERLDYEMNRSFSSFRHIIREFPTGSAERMQTQYIANRIFRDGGLIEKYLNHSEIKRLPAGQYKYLKAQADMPWRFSFSVIREKPADNFFVMKDVYRDESFLLYSEGVNRILKESGVKLWFNLVGFNGWCWQSFGPIYPFSGLDADDVFFFATEVNQMIRNDEELMEDVARDPVPYMMLFIGSRQPVVISRGNELVQTVSCYPDQPPPDKDALKKYFKIEYSHEVYRFGFKRWDEFPHFAVAYYDERQKELTLSAMTDRGFEAIAQKLKALGFNVSEEAYIRVHPTLPILAGRILKRKIDVNPHERLFGHSTPPEAQEGLDKVNLIMKLSLPTINAGKVPDIEALANETGIDIDTARRIVESAMAKINELRRGTGKGQALPGT